MTDLDAILTRSASVIERMRAEATTRRAPSAAMKRAALAKSDGRCARCDDNLSGGVEFDHFIPLWMKGAHSVENLDALCIPCHDRKTADDAANRAKCIRIARTEAGEIQPAGRLRGRGFDKTHTRGFDGKVRPRSKGPSQ